MPEEYKPTYKTLVGIRNELEKLSLTQAWSLRETDLYDFQRQLDRIDEARVNGNFHDKDGKPAELYVQRVSEFLRTLFIVANSSDFTISYPSELWLHILPDGIF